MSSSLNELFAIHKNGKRLKPADFGYGKYKPRRGYFSRLYDAVEAVKQLPAEQRQTVEIVRYVPEIKQESA